MTGAECFRCGASATETFGNAYICEGCKPDGEEGSDAAGEASTGETKAVFDSWGQADFQTTECDTYPPELLEREQWMGHVDKRPFAPWGDRDASAPCTRDEHDAETTAECECDARWKWGHTENYVDGEGIAIGEDDPRLDGRVYLQQEEDPYGFVDGDDVRDPETGEIHPAFLAILEHLGLSYADVSTSGSGVHAYYRGEIPVDGEGQATFELDTEPWGANDDAPAVEIYANKHVCVATGEHVPGTPREIVEWDDDALRAILEANGYDDKPEVSHDTDLDREELEGYEPEVTERKEKTTDIRDVLKAVDSLRPRDVGLRSRQTGSGSSGWEKWDPSTYRTSGGNDSLHTPDRRTFYDHKEDETFGVLKFLALEEGIIRKARDRLAGQDWWKAVEKARERGASIPQYVTGERERAAYVETCTPPGIEPAEFDRQARWDAFAGERYEEVVAASGPVVWADEAGAGKTTNAARAAAGRGRPHAVLFDKHEKAREFRKDDATPGEYYHLRGGPQKRDDVCMDADHADRDCPEHGHTQNCPAACPVYDLAKDEEIRQKFERLKSELGPVQAHLILGDDLPGHDEDGACWWLEQFAEAGSAERIVGVHEYQTLQTVQACNDEPRDVIIDESPGTGSHERALGVEGVLRFQGRLEQLASVLSDDEALKPLAEFAELVLDVLTDQRSEDDLAELEPPEIPHETHTVEVEPDDLPEWCDPEDVYQTTKRDPRGMPGSGAYRKRTATVADRPRLDEALAQAKLAYNESTVKKMKNGGWKGEPLAMDLLFAAAAAAGVDEAAVGRAIAAPTILDGHCPRCGGQLAEQDGARFCSQDGQSCGWDERTDHLVQPHDEPARADVRREGNTLHYKQLPDVSDLPDSPLVLDATVERAKVAGLYGVSIDEVRVDGDEPVAANLHTTQVLNGQYHAGTLADGERARERVQETLDKVGRLHKRPLVVGKRALLSEFDIPENAETLHYHAARGLNREECDAVVCIGAPHPRVDDLEREAELLAKNRPDIRVGGEEHSTRRDCENPPVYRKLRFVDDDGDGRAVATKHFTGLTGALFRERREKELEQVVHRIRPLLADETKHAYLLTNVPTALSVDEVCTFDELADPLSALFPVSEGALDLALAVRDAAAGDAPDGFRAETLVEAVGGDEADGTVRFRVSALHRLASLEGLDVSERTVRRWVDDLEDVGLLSAGGYESREGVPYAADIATLTEALSVLSSNASVEVALRRRLAALASEVDSAREWLAVARDRFGLTGDHCDRTRPLDPGGTPP